MSDENNTQLNKILEGAILAAGEPLSVVKLQALFDQDGMPEKDEIEAALGDIKASCETRGFDLVEVASGWRFQVRESLALWVNRLWEEKPQKYSRALLETMALIAYRQPLTRGDIEEVRGVAVSSHIIKTLTERGWVKVVGHRDVPGRPALYATTKSFLDYFGLKSLDELPSLGELKDIESLNQDLGFGVLESAADDKNEDTAAVAAQSVLEDGDQNSLEPADQPEMLNDEEGLDTLSGGEQRTDLVSSADLFSVIDEAPDNGSQAHEAGELNDEPATEDSAQEALENPPENFTSTEDIERQND